MLRGWLAVALIGLSGCPHRFDSRADPIPASTDPATEQEYRQARQKLEVGEADEAASRYAQFIEHHPQDPLVRSATIGEARAKLQLGQTDQAKALLESIAKPDAPADSKDPVESRARFLLGAALIKSGDYARGRTLLLPFRDVAATSDDEVDLHALFASAALGLSQWSEALTELEQFWNAAHPAERRYIATQAHEAATHLSPDEAERLWRGEHKALLTAFVGPRVSEIRKQSGDAVGAQHIDDDVQSALVKLGLARRGGGGHGLHPAIGVVLPLSGKARALGERALRGALLGAELLGGSGQGSITVEVRDTASDPAKARDATEELGRLGLYAIVGPPDRAEASEVASASAPIGVPLFALGPDDGKPALALFHVARPRSDAAKAAARCMSEDGMKRVAVLAPDNASGNELARVFNEAAKSRGLEIVRDIRFGEAVTTFVKEATQLGSAKVQAVFLPATAAQIDLIAPQLASSGLTTMDNLKASGHEVRIYATADGLTSKNIVRSGKYLQNATLFPPFWADANDPRAQAFLDRYHEAYGDEPSVLDALAYDAVRALRLVISQRGDPSSWSDVTSGLRELDSSGLTGALGFSADGQRNGDVAAWIVDNGALRLRAKH